MHKYIHKCTITLTKYITLSTRTTTSISSKAQKNLEMDEQTKCFKRSFTTKYSNLKLISQTMNLDCYFIIQSRIDLQRKLVKSGLNPGVLRDKTKDDK